MRFISESTRFKTFWLADKFKGSPIGKNLDDISSILDKPSSRESSEKRDSYLSKILDHAVMTTPFYREAVGPDRSMNNFPVVNKNVIRDNFENFRSEIYKDRPFVKMTTSGSTGTPFTIFQNLGKKERNYADTIYFADQAGYNLGHRLYYLKIWSSNNRKSKLKSWMQNIVPVDVLKLNDDILHDLINNINNDQTPKGLLAYASALDVLVNYLERKNLKSLKNVESVIAISESLSPFTRRKLAGCTGSSVVSRYSNLENGILAQQCAHSDEFHVNSASYHIEIFDLDKDVPVVPGTLGRIVVTDLFNYAMPMIRYDTGDVGILSETAECDFKTPVLTKLEGRKLDLIWDCSGNLISSYLVYKNMWKYTEIDQYQLIQEGEKEYRFKINMQGKFTREKLLVEEFKSYLGKDADFKVEYVNEIPLLASGKRKKIINNYIRS